jgi:threonine synthase
MRFLSTRGKAPAVSFSRALVDGLAPDGGLYVPEDFPEFDPTSLEGSDFHTIASRVLEPFASGDPLETLIPEICEDAFDFPVGLRPYEAAEGDNEILELFHGPTAAFKDFGARFLAACLARVPSPQSRTVLVATSGDTGGAVAAAFHGRPGFEVLVLYPKGKVSPRQEKQLTCWGDNVHAFAVRGDFDDCQRLVKEAFADPWWRANRNVTSANSINVGRLLPQVAYYAAASSWFLDRHRAPAGFLVPSGNLGNALGALWAKRLGFPIREVVLVANANRPVPDYFATGVYKPQPTVATLANAMDVGNPSNMERVLHLYPTPEALRADASSLSVSDAQIRKAIVDAAREGEILCPHTATAAFALRAMGAGKPWVLVATAHPAKFDGIVEPLVGRAVKTPPSLATILTRESRATEIDATLAALRASL